MSQRNSDFPLTNGSTERTIWHAPRLFSDLKATPGVVMGNRAFMRAWAARRAMKMTRPQKENTAPAGRSNPASPSGLTADARNASQPEGTSLSTR